MRNYFSAFVPAMVFLLLGIILGPGKSVDAQPREIIYKDWSSRQDAVRMAQSIWSRQIGVRWREARDGEEIDLVLHDSSSESIERVCGGPCLGWSTTLGNTDGTSTIIINEEVREEGALPLVVHEMGHFFGLEHEDNCSIMRPRSVTSERCPTGGNNRSECGFSEGALSRLRDLYQVSSGLRAYRCFGFQISEV